MMRRFFLFLISILSVCSPMAIPVYAYAQAQADVPAIDASEEQPAPYRVVNEYYIGVVDQIVEDSEINIGGFKQPYQKVKVKIVDGPNKGRVFEHDYQLPQTDRIASKLRVGEKVVVVKVIRKEGDDFYVAEKYRVPAVYILFFAFFALAVLFGRRKGFSSVLGLGFSLVIIIKFILPMIIAGYSPVLVSVFGGLGILIVSLYLAHGLQKRTTLALIATLITLGLSGVLAVAAVSFAKLFGLGSEEALSLLQGQNVQINLRGLLLGGIIIGSLGVLDDITTAQAAVVDEIHRADPRLGMADLYARGLNVGREHIASLVNTLALAYVGASLPVLLLFSKTDFPFWVTLNSEYLVEEIVRTLVGSMALMLAVPITTALTAYYFSKEKHPLPPDPYTHSHHH